MKSYVRTKKHRLEMSELKRRQFKICPEIREKIALSKIGKRPPNFGKKDTLKVRKKKSKAMKLAFREGRAIPLKGKLHPRYTGFNKNCYIKLFSRKYKNGYILEHRLIMENYLGRKLTKNEVVHHINGNQRDNRIENLLIFKNRSEHSLLHEQCRKHQSSFQRLDVEKLLESVSRA